MTAICVSLTEATTEATLARMAALAARADLFEIRADFAPCLDLAALLKARPTAPSLHLPARVRGRPLARRRPGGPTPAAAAGRPRAASTSWTWSCARASTISSRRGPAAGLVVSFHDVVGMPEDLDGLVRRDVGARGRRREDRRHAPNSPPTSAGSSPSREVIPRSGGPTPAGGAVSSRSPWAPWAWLRESWAAATGPRSPTPPPVDGREAAPGQLPAETLADAYRVRSIGPSTRVYGILGVDILRSLSPAIHNRAFAERGLDAVYVPLQADSLAGLPRRPGRTSTSPASASPAPGSPTSSRTSLRMLEPSAVRAGSVNTVVVQDGQMHGSSTDGDGVLGPLRHHLVVSDRPVTIVGAGGAARAAAFALVGGRRASAGVVPARRAGGGGGHRRGLRPRHDRLPRRRALGGADQRHPGGLRRSPGECRCRRRRCAPARVVFDMVYEPRETPLLRAARARAAGRSTASRCSWPRRSASSRPGPAFRRPSRR